MKKNSFSIIWDWNGTIVDDAFVFIKIMNSFLNERDLPLISLKDYQRFFVFPVKNYYINLGFDFTKESFEALSHEFISEYKKAMFSPGLVNGVRSLISSLNKEKITQAIVSAQENSLLKKAVNYYKLNKSFVCIQGTDNYKAVGKIDIAQKVFNTHFKNSKKTILIGDTEHDAEVAKALCIDCCLVSYGHSSKERLEKTGFPVVSSVSELQTMLFDY